MIYYEISKYLAYFTIPIHHKLFKMHIDHAAIWTPDPERLRDYYISHFGARSGSVYTNEKKQFRSYFLSFGTGARLEIMTRPDIPASLNDTAVRQHLGIIHLAFGVRSRQEVDEKALELKNAGYLILSGPRITGDGCYEFETLDPDGNRLEVTTPYTGE